MMGTLDQQGRELATWQGHQMVVARLLGRAARRGEGQGDHVITHAHALLLLCLTDDASRKRGRLCCVHAACPIKRE